MKHKSKVDLKEDSVLKKSNLQCSLCCFIASSPTKRRIEAAKATKYLLPSIPEKVTQIAVTQPAFKQLKEISTPRVYYAKNVELNKTSQQHLSKFNQKQSCKALNDEQTRSISNVRTQGYFSQLHHGTLVPISSNDASTKPLNPSQRKKMKKLKLICSEMDDDAKLRNRSVSIESSPGHHNNFESGRPTDVSSNERTSEESRKGVDTTKVDFKRYFQSEKQQKLPKR